MSRVFSLAIITSLLMGCGSGGGGSGSSSSTGTSGSSSGGSVTASSVLGDDMGNVENSVTNIGRKPTLGEDFSLDEKFSQMTPHLSYAADNNMLSFKHDTGVFAQKIKVLGIDQDTRLDLSQTFKFWVMGISFEPELKYSNIQLKSASQKFGIDLFQVKMMIRKSFAYNGSSINLQSGVFRDSSALLKKRYGVLLKADLESHGKAFGLSYNLTSFQGKAYQDVKLEFSISF